jgi:cold-inducible RNA-binding protein
MGKKLFVGGLAWATTDQGLKDAFAPHGEITEAVVITDRETSRSRGFGFVTFASDGDAANACTAMNGQDLDGRSLNVNEAQDRQRSGGRDR